MSEIQMGTIQWFPGHMTKTRRMIAANLSLVDAVVEILDARIPSSSQNPEMQRLVKEKPRMLLLNKADMADPNATARWVQYYQKQNPAAGLQDRKGHQAICPDGTQPAAETADGKTGKSRHCRCTDSPDDCRNSKRWKIFIHQSHGTVQKGKSGRPSGCHPHQAMGENRRPDGIARYAGGSLAEVR